MKSILSTTICILAFAAASFATDYYATPTGTGGTCSIGSPCDLQTLLSLSASSGDNFYLCGPSTTNTFVGRFTSTLTAGTVTSCAGKWAVIDGGKTVTLTGNINASVTTIPVSSTAGIFSGTEVAIDTEMMQVSVVTDSTHLLVNRGWSPNIGGAVSHTSGADVVLAGSPLFVSGTGVTYKSFEVTNNNTNRDLEPGSITGEGCCGFYAHLRGDGIAVSGGSNSFLMLVVHENLDGFFIGSATSNTTVAGCLIYNNGTHYFNTGDGREEGSGHGIYTENASGFSRIYENVIINNFNFNGQFYGVSGPYVGGDHQKNVFANAGAPLGGLDGDARYRNFNIIYGPNSVRSATANIVNNHYWAPTDAIGGTPFNPGYGAGITAATITGNYFVGGVDSVQVGDITTITFTGNNIFGGASANQYINLGAVTPTGTWNNNTYHHSQGRSVFDGSVGFASWKSTTGFDSTSTETNVDLPDTVVVIPSSYQTGRANVVIYAASAPSTINVNLSTTGLSNGQAYTIKNAFDFFGTVIATGTYNSGAPTISVNLASGQPARNVATPIGMAFTAATTCPNLCVMVVEPSGATATSSFSGTISFKNTTIQ